MTFLCSAWLDLESLWAMPPKQSKPRQKPSLKATMSMGSRKLSKSMFYYKAKNLLKGRFFIDDNHKLGEDCRLPRK